VAGGAEGGGQAGHGLGGDPGLGAAVGGPGLALEPPGRRLRLAAPQLEGAHGPGHPGHEHVVLGPLDQPQDRPHDLEAGVGLAAVGEHEREHAAGAAHPVVVAEGLGDPHRLLGQPPGLVEPAGGERAARLEPEGGGGDPPVPAQEPLDGRGQQRLGGLVPVPQVQDDPLEGPGGVDDEGVPGRLGGVEGLDAEPPGAVEVGEEPPDGRQGEAQGAQRLVALLGGDLQGPLGGVVLQTERAGGVGDQRDAGE
jgi:hypothetical protein